MRKSLAIIGAGRVGRALGRRLLELGWSIGAVTTRSATTARSAVRFIGAGRAFDALSHSALASRLILIATPDEAIASVADQLVRLDTGELSHRIVLHTSGALDSSVLQPLRAAGAAVGSMHPLQSFSDVRVPSLEGKIFAIEGDTTAVALARSIARALGGVPAHIDAENKPLYHAAGTLAAGQALVIVEAAVQLLISLGMKRRQAVQALLPMTRQVLDNYEGLGARVAWTGPLARGDYGVVAKHVDALRKFSPEYREAYESLNRLAGRLFGRTGSANAGPADRDHVLLERRAQVQKIGS
jgi:predicted short-subunit dehydrogenase-like oxidoreductase (DUF2520 family)